MEYSFFTDIFMRQAGYFIFAIFSLIPNIINVKAATVKQEYPDSYFPPNLTLGNQVVKSDTAPIVVATQGLVYGGGMATNNANLANSIETGKMQKPASDSKTTPNQNEQILVGQTLYPPGESLNANHPTDKQQLPAQGQQVYSFSQSSDSVQPDIFMPGISGTPTDLLGRAPRTPNQSNYVNQDEIISEKSVNDIDLNREDDEDQNLYISKKNNANVYKNIAGSLVLRTAEKIPKQIVTNKKTITSSFPSNHVIERKIVYGITDNQKKAQDLNLPIVEINKTLNWNFQTLPPNIAQRVYIDSNLHLNPTIFQYEIDTEAFKHTLHNNDIYVLKAFLDKMSSINVSNRNGNTLLTQATYHKNHDAMLLLIQRGCDVNKANKFNISPLHFAAYNGDIVALSLLIENDASINTIDSNGMTPIMYATLKGHHMCVKRLLANGVNLDIRDKNGRNVFTIAKQTDHKKVLYTLQHFNNIERTEPEYTYRFAKS